MEKVPTPDEIAKGTFRKMTKDLKTKASEGDIDAQGIWIYEELFEAVQAWFFAGKSASKDFAFEMLDVIGLIILFKAEKTMVIAEVLKHYEVTDLSIIDKLTIDKWVESQTSRGREPLNAEAIMSIVKDLQGDLEALHK